MFQILIRTIAIILLALAVVLTVLDITRTISANALVLTPAAQTLEAWRPGAFASMEEGVSSTLHPIVWSPVLTSIMALPSFLLCFFLSMLLFWSAERRRKPYGRFSGR